MAASDASSQAPIYLEPLDWAVIGLYGVFIFAIAFWACRKIKDCGGYLMGSRRLGKWMMMASAFAGGTNANQPVAVAAAAFQRGLSGIWLHLTWMLITPFFWLYPPLVRRLRIVTMADAVRMRFGPFMNYLFKIISLILVPISMGLGLKSAAVVLEIMTGGAVSGVWALAAIAVPTLCYTLLGGVIAAYATDVWQSLLIVVLSFLLIPFAIHSAGGPAELEGRISEEFTRLFSSVGGDFGFWWIVWFGIGITFSAVLSSVGGASAAATELDARMGVIGSVVKRFCIAGWGLVGLFGIVLFSGHPLVTPESGFPGASPDNIFPLVSAQLLPAGLRGLMVASMLAAVMSSLDAGLLNFSGMFVNNFYQEHWVKHASPRHYLRVTRGMAFVGLAFGWYIAAGIGDLVEFTTIVEPLNSLTGVAILTALMWRRVTGAGAIASVLVATPLFLAVNRPDWPQWAWLTHLAGQEVSLFELFNLRPVAEWLSGLYGFELSDPALGYLNEFGGVARLPVQVRYPMYLIPTLFTLAGVSLLTKQHNPRAVAEFYCRLDTPVGEEHKIREAGFEVDQLEHLDLKDPELVMEKIRKSGHGRLLMADLFYLPRLLRTKTVKLSDYKQDWIGIGASLVFIVVFLFGLDGLVRWLF
ncbi:MAG: sodium:solute symporter family protein [Verrucomicrobia bacterium]|nr:sodium:solute symporter family protein [Verrucomicrobiota bacterium]MCH8528586.1 sodium:solute symporter family protein [Kiritimatiellia bacterium]